MPDNDSFPDDLDQRPIIEPAWVTTTLRLTPTPTMAIVAMAFFIFASLMCFFFASAEQSSVGWALCGLFAAPAVLIGAASVSRHIHRKRVEAANPRPQVELEKLPTAVIIVGAIFYFSWLMMIGLHVFRNVFAANQPGGLKYNVTLGIALAASLYMTLHGRSVIRRYIGPNGGANRYMTTSQAMLVIALFVAFGA